MNICVFDSGRGGEYIAAGLREILPHHTFTVINDRKHMPYGSRTSDEIISLTIAAIEPYIATHPLVVIACNSVTMAGIDDIRRHFPDTKFVGTDPMIKPAALTSASRRVSMMATPLTLASIRYRDLKTRFADELTIDEIPTYDWARQIENGNVDAIQLDAVAVSVANGSDTLILACTHYLALRDRLYARFPDVTILEPTEAIARQIERLLSQS